MQGETSPISLAEFQLAMQGIPEVIKGQKVAVAVSGGPDSLCLLYLLSQWAEGHHVTLEALTVDHGLRQMSSEEARRVQQWCQEWSVPHSILRWEGEKPSTGVPQAAREARYALLAEWCRRSGCSYLFLGHHFDDQVETVFLRLMRGSGLNGLIGMRPAIFKSDICVLRPLLGFKKQRLLATLKAIDHPFVIDESNFNKVFMRNRLRAMLDRFREEHLPFDHIGESIHSLTRGNNVLEGLMIDHLLKSAIIMPYGMVELALPLFLQAPAEIVMRALSRLLPMVSGKAYPPRMKAVERTLKMIRTKDPSYKMTLYGCLLVKGKERLRIFRESRHLPLPSTQFANPCLWDGRFLLSFKKEDQEGMILRPLGCDGWAQIKGNTPLPFLAALTMPSLWRKNRVVDFPMFWAEQGTPLSTSSVMEAQYTPRLRLTHMA